MVSSFTVKKKLMVAIGALCAVLLIVWAVRMFFRSATRPPCPWENMPEVECDEIPGHPTPKVWSQYPIRLLSKDEYAKLNTLFTQLTDAYTNGYYDVVARQIDTVPDLIYSAPGQSFRRIVSPLQSEFEAGFLSSSALLKEFEDATALSRFLNANFKIARRFGGIDVIRCDWGKLAKRIEPEVLLQLKRYREKFRTEGNERLVQVVDRFTNEWCRHIESEDGCTRQYMWRVVDSYLISRKRIVRQHGGDMWISREQIFRIVRPEADQLIEAGYTPKWMDEFCDEDYLVLKAIYRDIENAYTNNLTRALHQSISRVSSHLGRDYGRPFLDLDKALMSLFKKSFVEHRDLRCFETLEEFERFASVNVETAHFLCSCEFHYGADATFWMRDLESLTFQVIRDYVDRFHREGKREFEMSAQKHLEAWIAHIESRQSFSYKMASYWWSFSPARAHDVHFGIDYLINLGYTPKWLDEFK